MKPENRRRSLEGTGQGKGEVVPTVWSVGLFMKIFQLLNYCICLFRFHSFGGVLKFAISIHNWILNIILVMPMWLHLTWLAKAFCDSVRHLAWNGNMWKGPQKHNRPVTSVSYFFSFLTSLTFKINGLFFFFLNCLFTGGEDLWTWFCNICK